jgi:glycosyltransferase involved in cell wall biosynthesis
MQAKWKKKISVIPHGVEKQPPKKDLSISPWYKEKIGIQKEKTFDILMFGFIAGYKGSLLGAQHFFKYLEDNPKTRYRLILAGGKSPTQKDNPGYQKYFKKVVQTSQKSDRIIHTGFVPEKDLPLIHNKADLILLPYQNLMSSSGPLSLAITHQKPFLLSKALRPYTLTPDFKSAINSYLKSSYPVLEPKKGNIFKQIEQVIQDKALLKKLKAISQELYTTRSWSSIGDKYWEIIK